MSKLAIHGGKPVLPDGGTALPVRVEDEERRAVNGVLKTGMLSQFRAGPEVRKFEEQFAHYIGVKHAVATTSGTTALHTSLVSLGLSPGDEVLVPAVTFVSTASVALQEGLKIVFVDVDEYYCMDPESLKSKITERSKVIIPVHLYGQPADMDAINKLAQKHNLTVIEDACQSHGAYLGKKHTGNLGDLGCFSFYETKNMTTGEGGMITTNNTELYNQIILRREHGSPRGSRTWYNYEKLGFNYNMTEIQGVIGQAQLKKLDAMNSLRISNSETYETVLADLDLALPKVRNDVAHVRHNYPVLLPPRHVSKRDFFVEALQAEGIPVDVAYPCPLYKTPLFEAWANDANCPISDDVTSRLFTLFTDSAITTETIKATKKAIERILRYLDETA